MHTSCVIDLTDFYNNYTVLKALTFTHRAKTGHHCFVFLWVKNGCPRKDCSLFQFGIANAFLSQREQGKSSPSLSTFLWQHRCGKLQDRDMTYGSNVSTPLHELVFYSVRTLEGANALLATWFKT